MMPSAKMEACEKAPPAKASISPSAPPLAVPLPGPEGTVAGALVLARSLELIDAVQSRLLLLLPLLLCADTVGADGLPIPRNWHLVGRGTKVRGHLGD